MKLSYFLLLPFLLLNISFSSGQKTANPEVIESYFNNSEFNKVIEKESEILSYVNSENDSISADLLYYLGDSYFALDQLAKGLEIMEKEALLREKLSETITIDLADIYFNLAYYQSLNNQNQQALKNFSKAANAYKSLGEEFIDAYIESKIEQADLYTLLSQPQQSLNLLDRLETEVPSNSASKIDLYLGRGNAYLLTGNYNKAITNIELAGDTALQLFGKESTQYLKSLIFLGDVKFSNSSYADSELAYLQALKIAEKIGSSEFEQMTIKNNLAILYWRMGLNMEALDLISSFSYLSVDPLYESYRLQNKALILTNLQQYDSAKLYFDKSLALLGDDMNKKAEFIKNRAATYYMAVQKFDQAINELKQALKLEESQKTSSVELSKYYLQLGKAFYRVNDINQANKYLLLAQSIRDKSLPATHPLLAESTVELAELEWFKGRSAKAKEYYQLTFNNYFDQIKAYFPALSEQEKANFYVNTLRPAFEAYNSFILANYAEDPSLLTDMYNYQLATKGLIMYSSAKVRESILQKGDSNLMAKYDQWMAVKENLAKVYSLTEKERDEYPLKEDSLSLLAKNLEKELNRTSATFAEANNFSQTKWVDIQKLLKAGEAAIEMIRFRDFTPDSSGHFNDKVYYAALLIDQNSQFPELILFKNGKELEEKYIKNYKNAIKYQIRDKYSYEQYWQPIAKKTKQYKLLYFSPDGIFNKLSINSLFNNSTNKYVLEEQNVLLLTNTKDLLSLNSSNSSSNTSAQLFGFPNYNKGLKQNEGEQQIDLSEIAKNASLDRGLRGSLSRYVRGNSLVTMLPGTKAEVEKIDSLYSLKSKSKSEIHLMNDADEQQLKAVSQPQILHIATHGFFLEDNDLQDLNENIKYAQNPLLKSGLILAGANSFISEGLIESNQQDGILTAYEAMNLDLSGTELVVLSACETGLGDVKNGEGVYGLRRAFFIAGTQSLIMSLWSVDDAATQDLMNFFYEEWLNGASRIEAFKTAQLKTKEKYPAPHYWAAFVMVGI